MATAKIKGLSEARACLAGMREVYSRFNQPQHLIALDEVLEVLDGVTSATQVIQRLHDLRVKLEAALERDASVTWQVTANDQACEVVYRYTRLAIPRPSANEIASYFVVRPRSA